MEEPWAESETETDCGFANVPALKEKTGGVVVDVGGIVGTVTLRTRALMSV
jgi:hypothetical protein